MPDPGDARGKGVINVDFPEDPHLRSGDSRDQDEGREEIFLPDENAEQILSLFRKPEDSASKEVSVDYEQLSGTLEDRVLAIYVEYRPRLFRYVRRLGVHRDDAEELIHETFLRLIHRLQQEGDIGSVEGWIIRVTHNLSIDLLLKNGRDEGRIQDTSEHEWAKFVDPGMNPEEELMKQQQKEKMETALSGMSPQHRSCFLMRVQGFRYKDIGTALGVSGQRAALIVKQVAVRLAVACG